MFSISGQFGYAGSAIIIATVLDLFDGRIARMLKKKNPYGKHLDNLADIITFCVAPAVMFYVTIWGRYSFYPELKEYIFFNSKMIGVSISFLFIMAGAIRLAIFSEKSKDPTVDYYTGLTTTVSGSLLTLFISFNFIPSFADAQLKTLFPVISNFKLPIWLILTIYCFLIFMMLSKFRFDRPGRYFLFVYRGMPLKLILINVIFIGAVVYFTKFFLLLFGIVICLKPVFLWKTVPKSS